MSMKDLRTKFRMAALRLGLGQMPLEALRRLIGVLRRSPSRVALDAQIYTDKKG